MQRLLPILLLLLAGCPTSAEGPDPEISRLEAATETQAETLSDLKQAQQEFRKENETARARIDQLLEELTAQNEELARLRDTTRAATKEADRLEEQLALFKKTTAVQTERHESLQTRVGDLESRLEKLRKERASEAQRLAETEKKLRATMERNERLRKAYRKLIAQLRHWTPLPNLHDPDVPRIEASILNVQDTDGQTLVVLDAGSNQEVRAGLEFALVRSGQAVAKVLVETVNPEWSGGKVIHLAKGEKVRPGDRLTTKIE